MKLITLKQALNSHEDGVWALAWSPACSSHPSSLLLTGSVDETVKVWSGDGLEPVRTNTGHALGVVSVAADASGRLAASSSLDSFVRVFEVESNATVATLESPPSETWGVAFEPQGRLLAVASGGSASVKLWATDTWEARPSLEVPAAQATEESRREIAGGKFVLSVAWNADGSRLACSTVDGTVAVYDVEAGRLLHCLEGHHMGVRSLAFSPTDPRILFTACDDRHIRMFDAQGKTPLNTFSGHGSWVLSVAVSPDGQALASGSSDRTVRLWDLKMRSPIQTMKDHSDSVWGVAFRPLGGEGVRLGRLASVSDDKSICLFDYS